MLLLKQDNNAMSTYKKYKKWYKKYAHGKSKYQEYNKTYSQICRNKNIMKVLFNLKVKSYKYELIKRCCILSSLYGKLVVFRLFFKGNHAVTSF